MIRNEIAILLARLTWPSPTVRERAAAALADLLVNSIRVEEILELLLDWISKQPTASAMVNGLLVLLKAAGESPTFISPPAEQLVAVVRRPSLLSRMLLEELGRPDPSPVDWKALTAGPAPNGFEPTSFFESYIRTFVAPLFSHWAEDIERHALIPFTRQWAYEATTLLNELGRKESATPLRFRGNRYGEHFGILDTFLSDIYRSAYLRTIAWAMTTGRMAVGAARMLAAETCPIDVGLWSIPPSAVPKWWPRPSEPNGAVDTVPAEVWHSIGDTWHQQRCRANERIVVQASGRVYEGKAVYDLEIFGAFQRVLGPSEPDLENVLAWLGDRPLARSYVQDLRFMGSLGHTDPVDENKNFADWSVFPACGFVRPHPLGQWQDWRQQRAIHLPMSYLVPLETTFRPRGDTVEVIGGSAAVAEWRDWIFKGKETHTANLAPSTGNYLDVDRQLVKQFEEKTKSTFVWICRLTGYHRKHDYEDYKSFTLYHSFGVRRVIIS